MRTPQDLPRRDPRPRGQHRKRWWIVGGVIALIIAIVASLKSLATVYTDSLWFSSVHLHPVWSKLLAVKFGLFASFGAAFFIVLWINLAVCDRLGASAALDLQAEDELVRRYQRVVRPYAVWVHTALALVVALIAAAGTVGEWNNWILFAHGVSFGVRDPQLHEDIGFFVFKLPFLSFVVNWSLVSLVVVLVITAVFHYLNGGIRAQRNPPRVRPGVKVHLSVLLAFIALAKAAGYLLQRYWLDVSGNGYVNGAGYTDVHARLPALDLLFWICLFAAAILVVNIWQRGWTLPVLALSMWGFVALAIGVVYPAVLQAVKVNPGQASLEKPYIQRNINATRAAYGLTNVNTSMFVNASNLNPRAVGASLPTLQNIRLWDPDPLISLQTFQKRQGEAPFYVFQSIGEDRYPMDPGTSSGSTPVLEGVRQIDSSNLPSSSWVNVHLAYTHGIGMALAPSNTSTPAGFPNFVVGGVPPTSTNGLPRLTQPEVYFGLQDPGYVIADTKQPEVDYEQANGTIHTSRYSGTGGVRLGSFLARAAFAVRLGDFNVLFSNQLTSKSRILFVRDIDQMVQKAAPFLSFDSDPYGVIVNGHIDWVIDAYTTTNMYPYSQSASSVATPSGSGLPSSYNYVRNSVKVVIDAYTGKMTFYAMDHDPILRTYEIAFPDLFTPASKMSAQLRHHLRYPSDFFAVQAAMYGRYHLTNPAAFYSPTNAWSLSPTVGAGSPGQALSVSTPSNGQTVSGTLERMSPLYQQIQLPGQRQTSFTVSEAYAPFTASTSFGNYSLPAFIAGQEYSTGKGQLYLYQSSPAAQPPIGPVQADAEIQQKQSITQKISALDQHGSQVLLGNTLMVPLQSSVLYVRPLYVTSASYAIPQLQDVIAVFGQNVSMSSTLDGALTNVLGTQVGNGSPSQPPPSTSSGSSGSKSPVSAANVAAAQAALKLAGQDYQQAQSALRAGGGNALSTYQSDINAMYAELQAAQQLLGESVAPATPPSTTTTTSKPGNRSGSTSTTAPASPLSTVPSSPPTTSPPSHAGTTTTKPNEA